MARAPRHLSLARLAIILGLDLIFGLFPSLWAGEGHGALVTVAVVADFEIFRGEGADNLVGAEVVGKGHFSLQGELAIAGELGLDGVIVVSEF